jgi:succinylglutamate desuccinylase
VIETSSQKHVNQQFDSVACRHSDFARSGQQEMESMFCYLRTADSHVKMTRKGPSKNYSHVQGDGETAASTQITSKRHRLGPLDPVQILDGTEMLAFSVPNV